MDLPAFVLPATLHPLCAAGYLHDHGDAFGVRGAGKDGGPEGAYVEYICVNRHARGRGVAKSLLGEVIADAARRGRNRVGLEVDDDSPTSADQLYLSLGWQTDYVTDSWFKDLVLD